MLSSPFIRSLLLLFSGFGMLCVVILAIVTFSVPNSEAISVLRWRLFFAEILLFASGLAILIGTSKKWLQPIVDLKRSVDSFADGLHPDRVDVDRDDELAQLVYAYDQMVQRVEARFDDLNRSRQKVSSDNEQLATVLEAMVEGVLAVDREERILLANMAAIRLLELKTYSVVGRRVWEAIRIPQIQELIRTTLNDVEHQRLEFAVPWTYSTVAVVASRLPGNPCPGAVLVLHDVTELRRLENLRRDFVSNVSHELKTPLATITACADTLLNGALDDHEVSLNFVNRISEQSERLNTLILDLLELARIESGEHVFHVDSVDVNEILRSSVDAHHAIAISKQLILKTEFAETQLMAKADVEGLRTIVDNLIGNAINYTRPNGTITVRSRREGSSVYFDVEDNGVGIAKEFQSRIFERFFRVDRARSREVGGTGLCLSIVKHLCQLFGGNIRVKSQLGQGSTFTVNLEAATD